MRSILVGVKRFITNKNTITIIAIIGSLLLLYWAYNKRIEDATSPKAVVTAISEIGPRTLITNELITVKKIPGSVIKNAYANTSDVVGKYVSNDSVIPANGMFYEGMVKSWDELPRSVYGEIPNGNTVVALSVTLERTYGNSIFPGNYIDLYYQAIDYDTGKLMIQKFIESIKVLGVLDSSGKSVFETNGALPTPAYLMFSVPEDIHLLLKKADYFGELIPVPRNANYSNGTPRETRVVSTYIKEYVLNKSVDVNAKDKNTSSIISTDDGNSKIDTMVIE